MTNGNHSTPGRIRASVLGMTLMMAAMAMSPGLIAQQRGIPGNQASRTPLVLGESLEFSSAVLGENRKIHVYLPEGYHPDSALHYPVIYLLDGSLDEDFVHVSGLVQFLSFPWVGSLPPTIVVGIGNRDRRRDFTFPAQVEEDRKNYPTTGGSARFMEFLETELVPLVESLYPVNSERALIGQSLGGLLASEILVRRPQLFRRYYIVSPSLWWDGKSLLDIPLPEGNSGPASVFLAVGREGKNMVKPARQWARKLRARHKVSFRYYRKFDHGNILHQALYDAFTAEEPTP